MNVDTFLIRIILLVIPGLAGYKTFRTIQSTGKSRKQIKDWQDFLTITFLSVLSYGLLFVVYQIIVLVAALSSKQGVSLTVTSIDALIDVGIKINFFEIVYASLIAMLVGLLAGVLYNKKTLYKLARFLRITKHYGDDDVWSFVTNPDDVEWLFVRDHKVDLVYYGSLSMFSATRMGRAYITLTQCISAERIMS